MWWLFEKTNDTNNTITYRYSCESDLLDGVVCFDKTTEEAKILTPCASDINNDWCQSRTLEKMEILFEEKFPDRRRVVCG